MSKIRYCSLCQRNVPAKKKFSWPFFLLLCLISIGIGGIVYIIWYLIKPRNICPICGGGGLLSANTQAKMQQADNIMKNQQVQYSATNNEKLSDPMEQLKKLQELKDCGAITEIEFNEKKVKLLESI